MREKITSRNHRPDRGVPLPNLLPRVWFFDFLPSFSGLSSPASHTPLHHAISPVPRLISDHRRSFVRSVMGVPLLSGRKHACKKAGKKSSPLVSVRSLSISIPLFFFSIVRFKFSDSVPFHYPCNHLCLHFGRTCPCAVSEIFYTIPNR